MIFATGCICRRKTVSFICSNVQLATCPQYEQHPLIRDECHSVDVKDLAREDRQECTESVDPRRALELTFTTEYSYTFVIG